MGQRRFQMSSLLMNLPGLAVGSCEDVSVRDEHTAALVLQEQTQEGALLYQHLSRMACVTQYIAPCQPAFVS